MLCAHLEHAGGIAGQARGLLGRTALASRHGMLFVRGRFEPFMWLHMMFMRFPIDVVFLNREGQVVRLNRELKPWRFSSIVFSARIALELATGSVAESGTQTGDLVVLEPVAEG